MISSNHINSLFIFHIYLFEKHANYHGILKKINALYYEYILFRF